MNQHVRGILFSWTFYVFYFLAIIRISWLCYNDAYYNWDTLPYMAIVLNFEEADLPVVHKKVYSVVRKEIPPPYRDYMIDSNHVVRRAVKEDYNKFFQYSSFFRTKPLYSLLSFAFYKAGMPLSEAVLFPSVLYFFCISILLLVWLRKYCPAWMAVILASVIMISPPLLEVAKLTTPDSLSALVLMIAFYFLFHDYKWYWVTLILFVSLLVRIDNLIMACLVMGFMTIIPENENVVRNKPSVLISVLVIVAWVLFSYYVLRYANYQDGLNNFYGGLYKKFNPVTLFREAVAGLTTLQFSSLSVVTGITFAALFAQKRFVLNSLNVDQMFFVVIVLHIVIKYVMFPDMHDRHYLSDYIILIMITYRVFLVNSPKSSLGARQGI